MSVFSFKRFDVINEKSAMKVNTDGVLLGALATIPATTTATDFAKTKNKLSVIDAGTGTGTIALMLAQRLEKQANVHILGVDIDKDSYLEAKQNLLNSSSKCNGIHINNLFKFFVWCEVSKSFTRSII